MKHSGMPQRKKHLQAVRPERESSRSPEVIPYETAIANAGRLKALADLERDYLAATQGTRALAEAAYRRGGPSVEEIEALYIQLRDASRERPPGRGEPVST